MRPHKRYSRRRAQHLLLDTQYVRAQEHVPQEARQGSAVPWRRKQRRQTRRPQGVQVLPVGLLLPVFSGNQFLKIKATNCQRHKANWLGAPKTN